MKFFYILLISISCVLAQKCPGNISIDISRGSFSYETKSFTFENITYSPEEYYRDKGLIKGCVCELKTCVNLCCPRGEAKINGKHCSNYDGDVQIDIYKETTLIKEKNDLQMIIANGCPGIVLSPHEGGEYFIQENGKLYRDDIGYINLEHYCLSLFTNETQMLQALICLEALPEEISLLDLYVMIISMLCLLLPLIANILLLDKRNIHSKCQSAYVVSLLCAYFVLVCLKLVGDLNTNICITLALFLMYSYMSSLFWMNITCIDIFLTFSGKKGFGLQVQSHQMKRFAAYCCYAFGAPLIIVIITIANNSDIHKDKWFYPNIGKTLCWFADGYGVLIHFYGPMGALIFANMVLFILTTLEIRKIRKDTAMLRQAENNKHHENNKQMYNIYIKLLITMGITWTWEFITVFVDWLLADEQMRETWYVTDLFNALYGVFIFYQSVCKKRTWIVLKIRYYNFIGQHLKANALATSTLI